MVIHGSAPPQDKGGDNERNTTSKRRGRTNLSLASSQADITITLTDTGYWINKKHNARAIQSNNPNLKLVMHRNSCHMVYCDDEGVLSWKMLMGKGSSLDRNQKVRDETLAMVKERAMRSTTYSSSSITASASGKASETMRSNVGKVKNVMTNGKKDLKKMKGEVVKKSKMAMGASALSKVMG